MNRLNGPARTRRYVRVVVGHAYLDQGWPAFLAAARACRQERVDPARLVWRCGSETLTGVTAVFEVVP